MRVEIIKQEIWQSVMQLTAYIGRNREQTEAIAVTEDNLPGMGVYLAEGVTEAENELRRHLTESNGLDITETEDRVTFYIEDLLRHAESTEGQIRASLALYLTHYIVSRWCGQTETAKDLAEPYSNSAGGYLSKLQSLVTQREQYTVEEDEYSGRHTDEAATGGNPMFDSQQYSMRQRDVNPVRHKQWPDGVMTDTEGNILVSKT